MRTGLHWVSARVTRVPYAAHSSSSGVRVCCSPPKPHIAPEAPGVPLIGEDQDDVGSLARVRSGQRLLLERPCAGSKRTQRCDQESADGPSRPI